MGLTASTFWTVCLFSLVIVGFGTAFALNSIAVSGLSPLWVSAVRASVASLIFFLIAAITRRRIPMAAPDLATYAIIGTSTGIVPFYLLAWGQMHVSSSLSAVFFASVPLITIMLSWGLFSGSKPAWTQTTGAVLGLIGVAVAFPFAASSSEAHMLGAFAVLVAALSYALGGLFLQRAKAHDPFTLMAGQFAFAAAVLLSVALFSENLDLASADLVLLPVAALLGLTGSALPLACFFLLMKRTDVVIASSVTFFVPFVALAVGVIALGEHISFRLALGFFLCLSASIFVSWVR